MPIDERDSAPRVHLMFHCAKRIRILCLLFARSFYMIWMLFARVHVYFGHQSGIVDAGSLLARSVDVAPRVIDQIEAPCEVADSAA
jgi:hypothetical protein